MATATGNILLVVEDDDIVRDGLVYVLQEAGYKVVTAANGRAALDYLRDKPAPTLILLDMMMPEYDGWTFLRLRSQQPTLKAIPVLVMTAIGVASPEWARDLGANGILRKPLAIETVLDGIKGCLNGDAS
jgi:CheY-like chemotaxis protein